MKQIIKHLQRSPEFQVTHLKRRPNLLAVPSRQIALFGSFAGQGASGHFSLPHTLLSPPLCPARKRTCRASFVWTAGGRVKPRHPVCLCAALFAVVQDGPEMRG